MDPRKVEKRKLSNAVGKYWKGLARFFGIIPRGKRVSVARKAKKPKS